MFDKKYVRNLHCTDCSKVVAKLVEGTLIAKNMSVRCSDCELIVQNKDLWTSNLEAQFTKQFGKVKDSPYLADTAF